MLAFVLCMNALYSFSLQRILNLKRRWCSISYHFAVVSGLNSPGSLYMSDAAFLRWTFCCSLRSSCLNQNWGLQSRLLWQRIPSSKVWQRISLTVDLLPSFPPFATETSDKSHFPAWKSHQLVSLCLYAYNIHEYYICMAKTAHLQQPSLK